MWFVVIPGPSPHLCYSDLISARLAPCHPGVEDENASPVSPGRHLDTPDIFVTINYPEEREDQTIPCQGDIVPHPGLQLIPFVIK